MFRLLSTKMMYVLMTAVYAICYSVSANALQYKYDRFGFRLSGYGTAGMIEPDFKNVKYLGDWQIRAQGNYAIGAGKTLGLVYSMNQIALDDDKYMHDAFVLFEDRNYGRIELGFTESVARKLGVGLPDVGGLRINEQPIFYKKIRPRHPVIPDTVITSGKYALRANIVSKPTNMAQYGLSIAGITDDYDYAVDAGIKIRQPNGKLKTAYSFGASFMDKPDGFETEAYLPKLTADWRAQIGMGTNVQYNSWIFALDARAIYDKNAINEATDGITVGTGVSYDLLNYTISLSYVFSDTGIWNSDFDDHINHLVATSFRYKYSENVNGWATLGITTETPFISAGVRLTF